MMRVLVLNGNPDETRPDFDRCCDQYVATFNARGEALPADGKRHAARQIRLRELTLNRCTGCWSCWWATPGRCAFKDDMESVLRAMLGADLVVWASPLIEGHISALAKCAQDRVIPLLHPYIELTQGESHHRRRYPRDIDIALLYSLSAEDTAQDVENVRTMLSRLAINARGKFVFCLDATATEEAVHASLAA